MPKTMLAELIKRENLKEDIIKYTVKADLIAKDAKAGQFVEIKVSEGVDPFLRRPISLHSIDKENGIIEFIFQLRGKGTNLLSKLQVGDKIDLIGPLGYGTFTHERYNKLALIGGGIGIFPLYEVGKQAKQENKEVNTYLGFRNEKFVVLEEDFNRVSTSVTITTDDGTYKEKGYAINFLKKDIEDGKIDCIYACGPLPMIKAVKALAIEKDIPCQISLEEKMACGMGLCLGCAVRTSESTIENPEYVHVCKAGPVFDATYVEI